VSSIDTNYMSMVFWRIVFRDGSRKRSDINYWFWWWTWERRSLLYKCNGWKDGKPVLMNT